RDLGLHNLAGNHSRLGQHNLAGQYNEFKQYIYTRNPKESRWQSWLSIQERVFQGNQPPTLAHIHRIQLVSEIGPAALSELSELLTLIQRSPLTQYQQFTQLLELTQQGLFTKQPLLTKHTA